MRSTYKCCTNLKGTSMAAGKSFGGGFKKYTGNIKSGAGPKIGAKASKGKAKKGK